MPEKWVGERKKEALNAQRQKDAELEAAGKLNYQQDWYKAGKSAPPVEVTGAWIGERKMEALNAQRQKDYDLEAQGLMNYQQDWYKNGTAPVPNVPFAPVTSVPATPTPAWAGGKVKDDLYVPATGTPTWAGGKVKDDLYVPATPTPMRDDRYVPNVPATQSRGYGQTLTAPVTSQPPTWLGWDPQGNAELRSRKSPLVSSVPATSPPAWAGGPSTFANPWTGGLNAPTYGPFQPSVIPDPRTGMTPGVVPFAPKYPGSENTPSTFANPWTGGLNAPTYGPFFPSVIPDPRTGMKPGVVPFAPKYPGSENTPSTFANPWTGGLNAPTYGPPAPAPAVPTTDRNPYPLYDTNQPVQQTPTWVQNLIELLAPKNREPYPLYAGNIPGTLGAEAGGPQYNVDMRGRGYDPTPSWAQKKKYGPTDIVAGGYHGRGSPNNNPYYYAIPPYYGVAPETATPTVTTGFGTQYGGNWGGGRGYADYGDYGGYGGGGQYATPQWLKDMYDNLYSWNFRG